MRKSGYFARVFELRPVLRSHESSRRSARSSCWRSNRSNGSARYGSRLRAFVPSPGWQVVWFAFMISTSILSVSGQFRGLVSPPASLSMGLKQIGPILRIECA